MMCLRNWFNNDNGGCMWFLFIIILLLLADNDHDCGENHNFAC